MPNTQASSSKFKDLGSYRQSLGAGYELLPFRFIALDGARYVLSNEVGEFIVATRAELYDFAQRKLAPGGELYCELKSKHFLLDSDSDVAIELLAMKLRTKSLPVSNFTGLHMFVVSLRCEHSCPYCQVSRQSEDKAAFDMSVETAERGIDFAFRSPTEIIKIEFQGGEPLLNFDLIKFIVIRAKSRAAQEQRRVEFVIATNLALINDQVLQFCRDHQILISTSLDGPKELHNLNRPRPGGNSFELAVSGIARARAMLGPDRVAALMTTTRASLPQVEAIIDEYVRQGFESIFLRPMSPYGFAIKTKAFYQYETDEWLEFYKKGLSYILDLNKNGVHFAEQYTSLILTRMLTPFGTGYVDLRSPAGIGIGGIIFNYDGDVYASDESRMLGEMGDKSFRLGNLSANSYEDVMLSDTLLNAIESSITESVPMCNDCGFQPYCGSDPVFHHGTQGDIVGHKPTSGFCHKNMEIFRHLIRLLSDDPSAREILLQWIRV